MNERYSRVALRDDRVWQAKPSQIDWVRYLNQSGKLAFYEGVDSLQPLLSRPRRHLFNRSKQPISHADHLRPARTRGSLFSYQTACALARVRWRLCSATKWAARSLKRALSCCKRRLLWPKEVAGRGRPGADLAGKCSVGPQAD